jgi:hypothetical protein
MSIKKHYLKNSELCKITFQLKEKVKSIETIRIPGDFNNWDRNCEPMTRLKPGTFSQTLSLGAGKSYQFRYLINDSVWANEPESDELVPTGYVSGEFNSLIII